MNCAFATPPKTPCVFWVTKFPNNAELASVQSLGSVLNEPGDYLISIMVRNDDGIVVHAGSLLIALTNATSASTVSVEPFRFSEPTKPNDNYYECVKVVERQFTLRFTSSKFKVTDKGLYDLSVAHRHLIDAVNLTKTFDNDAAFDKHAAFSRDIMLYAPTLLVPGWFGIPPAVSLTIPEDELNKLNNMALRPEGLRELGGIYVQNSAAKYVEEDIDDVAPWQFSFFRGDDCDGTSMAAYALLLELCQRGIIQGYTPMLVSGTAELSNGPEGHSWVMLIDPEGKKETIMCETTRRTADYGHFITASFAWTPDGCYAFSTINDNKRTLGVDAQAVTKTAFPVVEHGVPTETCLWRLKPKEAKPADLFKYSHTFADTLTLSDGGAAASKYIQWPGKLG